MTLRHNLEQFKQEARATTSAVREDLAERLRRVGVYAFERIQENSPVRTGAYRAEHVIERAGSLVYEHPDRPGPDRIIPVRYSEFAGGAAIQFDPNDLTDVSDALSLRDELEPFVIVNRRFYAEFLENGTARMEPRRVYARAADATQAEAKEIAREPSQYRELRGGS